MTDSETIRLECLRIASQESRGMGPSVIEVAERYRQYVLFGMDSAKVPQAKMVNHPTIAAHLDQIERTNGSAT